MGILTREAFAALLMWDEYGAAEAQVTVPWWPEPVMIEILPFHEGGPVLTDALWAGAEELLTISPDQAARIPALVFRDYEGSVEATDYGFVSREGEDHRATADREFGITDPDSALAAARLDRLQLDEVEPGHLESVVLFYGPWEEEHGTSLFLIDGVLSSQWEIRQ